jgi:hypothetical protein
MMMRFHIFDKRSNTCVCTRFWSCIVAMIDVPAVYNRLLGNNSICLNHESKLNGTTFLYLNLLQVITRWWCCLLAWISHLKHVPSYFNKRVWLSRNASLNHNECVPFND